jgi:predicted lipoprotein with Yx(FWY)xxD motif
MKIAEVAFAIILTTTAANAAEPAKISETTLGTVWTDQSGMTLYTYGGDKRGAAVADCKGKCAAKWPPFFAALEAKAEGAWTLVETTDRDGQTKKMWALDGWPLYHNATDKKPGDVNGNGLWGLWRAAKVEK